MKKTIFSRAEYSSEMSGLTPLLIICAINHPLKNSWRSVSPELASVVPVSAHSAPVSGSMGASGVGSAGWKRSVTACVAVFPEYVLICAMVGPKVARRNRWAALLTPSGSERGVKGIGVIFVQAINLTVNNIIQRIGMS